MDIQSNKPQQRVPGKIMRQKGLIQNRDISNELNQYPIPAAQLNNFMENDETPQADYMHDNLSRK